MELVDQQALPESVQLIFGIGDILQALRQNRQEFNVVEQELPLAIPLFGGRLRGVGAAVQLKVELADHARQILAILLQTLEKLVGRTHLRARQSLQILRPVQSLEHIAGRAAAAVADAEQHVALPGPVVVLVASHHPPQFLDRGHRVVGIGRWEVGEHLAAVDSLPGESLVVRLVEVVPRQLLGQKIADARLLHDLR